jgi:hypothetical protein
MPGLTPSDYVASSSSDYATLTSEDSRLSELSDSELPPQSVSATDGLEWERLSTSSRSSRWEELNDT